MTNEGTLVNRVNSEIPRPHPRLPLDLDAPVRRPVRPTHNIQGVSEFLNGTRRARKRELCVSCCRGGVRGPRFESGRRAAR